MTLQYDQLTPIKNRDQ